MKEPWPELLRADGECLMVLEAVLLAAAPQEGCALLIGNGPNRRKEATELELRRVWPCQNIWQPAQERQRRFAIDPREQLLAQRWCRGHGLAVIGAAHSHPSGDPMPSPTDLQLCMGPTLMLIRSGLASGESPWGAWWLEDDDRPPRPLPIHGSGAAAAPGLGE